MSLRKLIIAPVGNSSPAVDQIDGRMVPAMEIDDATGVIYVGGIPLTGGGGSGSVSLSPTADQTITGAYALIMGDHNSSFETPNILLTGFDATNPAGTGAFGEIAGVADLLTVKDFGLGPPQLGIYADHAEQAARPNGFNFGPDEGAGAGHAGLIEHDAGSGITFGAGVVSVGNGSVNDTSAKLKINALNVASLQVFANNAAAITGGLVVGDLYRTGANPDQICVVH